MSERYYGHVIVIIPNYSMIIENLELISNQSLDSQ